MKTIGIIGAMPSELLDIRKTLGEDKIEKKCGFEFYINEKNDRCIVSVCCGIAKVNAALCAQVLIDSYSPEVILNTGIAGGMDAKVKVCDIVISNEVIYHDLELRFLKNYPPYCDCFKADEKLINLAEKVCGENNITCYMGRIVSGEVFITNSAVKADIKERLNPLAVDMETAAIGHCAFLNDMPFVSVRCISDNADDDGAMSFDEFEKIAAKRVAEIVLQMADRI